MKNNTTLNFIFVLNHEFLYTTIYFNFLNDQIVSKIEDYLIWRYYLKCKVQKQIDLSSNDVEII